MAVKYNKLFHLLVDKKMSSSDLARQAEISLNIIARLRRDEYVSMESIEKICSVLNCKIDDIMEFTDRGRHA